MNRDDLDRLLNDPLQFRLYVITRLERHDAMLKALVVMVGFILTLLGIALGA